ncbi:MAG: NADH-quinone oxidoreductase subunit C [Betaproteobacteria bacterium]
MRIQDFDIELTAISGAMPVWRGDVDPAQWLATCERVRSEEGRLVAMWGGELREGGVAVHAALAFGSGLVWLTLPVVVGAYPSIAPVFPAAERMQRAIADLVGLRADVEQPMRPWLRHGAWPAEYHPLRREFDAHAVFPNRGDDYPFVRVEGDGVHEIPVGPVHAGTIEPGHFRFSILGERVLRLEERLGYTHKGVEKRFEAMTQTDGARLAGRISGDSTVAYAWAYAMAVEGATDWVPPGRALWLRALLLERERIANHLGDLGFLGNDAGFAFGLTQFSRLKEDMLRANAALFGHRYLMDAIVPGGVACDLDAAASAQLVRECDTTEIAVDELHRIYDDHPGLQDRFMATGRVTPELAGRLGLCGLAGRASGQAADLRAQLPTAPYGGLAVTMFTSANGDVAARVSVRFDEIRESLRLCRLMLERMPAGAVRAELPEAAAGAAGIGWVEGWRGEVFIAFEAAGNGGIHRLHAHDPSWQNWPVLEHAVIGNIVPDFPLINKSFNLSYSGHDL